MGLFGPTERERWASPFGFSQTQTHLGLSALDARSRELHEKALPRRVSAPRFVPDRPALNYWMSPQDLMRYRFLPGQLILGKFGGKFLGYLDDRPMVTIAGARAGKTSTILEPNLYVYPVRCSCSIRKANWPLRPICVQRSGMTFMCSIPSGNPDRRVHALMRLQSLIPIVGRLSTMLSQSPTR